ncbi:MAG: hypothetical protein ACKOYN_10645 [Planctomycetota bacterium]
MKAAPAPIEVRVGIFLNAVPEVDLQANNFTFDAYVWFVWNPETWPPPSVGGTDEARKSPAETFEIVQSSGLESNVVFARDGYICMQLKGKRLSFWDVRDYPFDRQYLEIVIEDSSFDSTEVRYVPDIANSGVMPGLRVAGALTSAPQIVVADYAYPTNFGDPEVKSGAATNYSRLTFTLPIVRDGMGVFFKLFTALFVSTLMALLALFINPTQLDPRFGLCVGGLFGTVASSYAVSSVLPDASGLCYADKLHVAALLCIFLTVAESAYSLSLHLKHGAGGAALAKRLDRITFLVITGGYLVTVTVLTMQLRA